jgi:hypothetical protein
MVHMSEDSILSTVWLLHFSVCCFQGKEIIEHFINELKKEGVTYLPPWSEPHMEIQDDENDDGDDVRYCMYHITRTSYTTICVCCAGQFPSSNTLTGEHRNHWKESTSYHSKLKFKHNLLNPSAIFHLVTLLLESLETIAEKYVQSH